MAGVAQMIRFKPDTWIDAVMRSFAMAAPNGNVYVEIAAPDVRFAAAVLLAFATLLAWRRLNANRKPVMVLLAMITLSMWPWLETSGNGRYYIPMLLAVGPLCVGLTCLLPLTRSFKFFLTLLTLGLQTFVLAQASPWNAWSWLAWKEAPYFQIDTPPSTGNKPVTYVTISSISYSLVAPQFPASSRWINLTSGGATPRDGEWSQQFISAADSIVLVAPSIREHMAIDHQPTAEMKRALNTMLASHRLALETTAQCILLQSSGVSKIGVRTGHQEGISKSQNPSGFWLCPLHYPVDPVIATPVVSARMVATFEHIEQQCPRFFPPNESTTQAISGGVMRHYGASDIRIYILDDGRVMYKFWRALNPVLIGSVDDVINGKVSVDCNNIRGRSGLPWDREI